MAQTKPKTIFHQVQQIIADQLNSDEVLSAANILFIAENAKDIDYEVQNALGKQGIVGLVMTPTAEYIGNTSSGELAYDLQDITVQIVENPPINRGLSASITALDAGQRVHEILAAPSFTKFGVMNPVSIEQGEDNGLIVCQAKFNCNIHATREPPTPSPSNYVYWSVRDGTSQDSFGLYNAGDEIRFYTDDDTYRYVQYSVNGEDYSEVVYDRTFIYTVQEINTPQFLRVIFSQYEP